jgi:hypothetical protein
MNAIMDWVDQQAMPSYRLPDVRATDPRESFSFVELCETTLSKAPL